MELIRDFVQSLLSVVTVIVIQVVELLKISSLIGSYIVTYIRECVVLISSAISVTCKVLKILCEDLLIFLQDVVQKCTLFSETSGVLFSYILVTLFDTFVYLKDLFIELCCLPIYLCMYVISTINTCILYVVTAAELLKRGVTLIGTGIWILLWNIPSSLLYALSYIPEIMMDILYLIFKLVSDSLRFSFSTICNCFIKILNFFSDIPCQAFAGLSVGLFMFWLVYKQRDILILYASRTFLFKLKVLRKVLRVLRLPFQQLRRQFHRHMSNCGNGDGNEYAFSGRSSSSSGGTKALVKLQKKLEKELEERLCDVCRERRKSVIVLPCRHLCMCEDCVLMVKRVSKMCPLCRCRITRTLNVYM